MVDLNNFQLLIKLVYFLSFKNLTPEDIFLSLSLTTINTRYHFTVCHSGLGSVVLSPDVEHEHAGDEEQRHHQDRDGANLKQNNGHVNFETFGTNSIKDKTELHWIALRYIRSTLTLMPGESSV